MENSESLWSRLSLMTKARVIGLGAFMLFVGVAIVLPGTAGGRGAAGPDRTLENRDSTLADWAAASMAARRQFARAYTEDHLGQFDQTRASEIHQFVEGTLRRFRMPQKGVDPRAGKVLVNGTKIWTLAPAGARLMGWPSRARDKDGDGG